MAYNDRLPAKCRLETEIVWIAPPLHDNFDDNQHCIQYGHELAKMAAFHQSMHTLRLKKGWDPHDGNAYLRDNGRYTAQGLVAYWEAVDNTIRFADTILFRRPKNPKNGNNHWTMLKNNQASCDRYTWVRKNRERERDRSTSSREDSHNSRDRDRHSSE